MNEPRNTTDPRNTVDLLNRLEQFGLSDEIFDMLHHFNGETIKRHRDYCAAHTGYFQSGGTNEKVQQRLWLMLDAYVSAGFSKPKTLYYLAKAAVAEVPFE